MPDKHRVPEITDATRHNDGVEPEDSQKHKEAGSAADAEVDVEKVARLQEMLDRGDLFSVLDFTRKISNLDPIFFYPPICEAVKRGILKSLRNSRPYHVEAVALKFDIYYELQKDPEFRGCVRGGILSDISGLTSSSWHYGLDRVKEYAKILGHNIVNDEAIQKYTLEKLEQLAAAGEFQLCTGLLEAIPVPAVANVPELQTYAESEIEKSLLEIWQDRARHLVQAYRVPGERFDEIVFNDARKCLGERNLDRFHALYSRWKNNLPEKEVFAPQAKNAYVTSLRAYDSRAVEAIITTFTFDQEFLRSPEVVAAAKAGILDALKKYTDPNFDWLRQEVGLPTDIYKEPELYAALRHNIIRQAGNNTYNDVEKALERAKTWEIALDGALSSEEQEYVRKAYAYAISRSQSSRIELISKTFDSSEALLKDGAKNAFFELLSEGRAQCLNIRLAYGLPSSIFFEPEMQEAAKNGFMDAIRHNREDDAALIEEWAALDGETVTKMVLDEIERSITSDYGAGRAVSIARIYQVEVRDRLAEPDMQEAALRALGIALRSGSFPLAGGIEEIFDLPEKQCYEIAKEAFKQSVEYGNVASLVKIMQRYKIADAVFSEPDLQVAAMKGLRVNLVKGAVEDAFVLEEMFALRAEIVQKIAAEAVVEILEKGTFENAVLVKDTFEPDMAAASAQLSFGVLLKISDAEGFEQLYARDAWHGAMERLLKVQSRAAKAEHDPWMTDMRPLVARLTSDGIIDRQKTEDGEILVEFVKNFGMYNLPKITRLFVELKRGMRFEELQNETKEDVVQLFIRVKNGDNFDQLKNETKDRVRRDLEKKIARMTGEQLINELRQVQRGIQDELLEDKIPRGMATNLGEEFFSGIKGATRWGRSDAIVDVIAIHQKRSEDVQTVEAPVESRERTFHVPLVVRAKPQEAAQEANEVKSKTAVLLSRKNGDKHTELGVFFSALETANAESADMTRSPDAWWKGRRDQLIAKMALDPKELKMMLATREEELRTKGTAPDKIEKILSGVQSGFEKKYQQATEQQAKLQKIEYPKPTGNKDADDQALAAVMETIAAAGKVAGAREMLLVLSIEHIQRVDPQWADRFARATRVPGEAINGERLGELGDFYVQYLSEHYLNRTSGPEHTGHTNFSEALIDALDGAWAKGKDLQKHVLVQKKAEFDAAAFGEMVVSKETMAVTRVRSRGILLTYSGDVGDACYSSKHKELAQGDFPGIEAEIFVTNRGTAQERLQGSALHIETATPSGERVLVLRANNPRENLIAQVDAASFVKMTIDDAIAKAEALGMDMVVVPLDAASASCSNRPAVAEYYKKHYGTAEKIALVNEPATNFNGYSNWNKDGMNPVVVVWKKVAKK